MWIDLYFKPRGSTWYFSVLMCLISQKKVSWWIIISNKFKTCTTNVLFICIDKKYRDIFSLETIIYYKTILSLIFSYYKRKVLKYWKNRARNEKNLLFKNGWNCLIQTITVNVFLCANPPGLYKPVSFFFESFNDKSLFCNLWCEAQYLSCTIQSDAQIHFKIWWSLQ